MNNDEEILAAHLADLARCADDGYYTYSSFLGLAEQSVLSSVTSRVRTKAVKFGGAMGCERVVVAFGDEEELGYPPCFPITCLKVAPKSQKYADRLTHRDFLGALINLGIERSVIGDIVILDNVGYIFVIEDMAEFVRSSLTKVKNTAVEASVCESLPEGELFKTECVRITLAGVRLDSIIAKVFSLSRGDAQALFKKRLVFLNGVVTDSASRVPRGGDVISVRGHGRMIYRGEVGTTKRGRLAVSVEVYV